MMAATWCFLVGSSRRKSFWTRGMRKVSVLPLPVTAWIEKLRLVSGLPIDHG